MSNYEITLGFWAAAILIVLVVAFVSWPRNKEKSLRKALSQTEAKLEDAYAAGETDKLDKLQDKHTEIEEKLADLTADQDAKIADRDAKIAAKEAKSSAKLAAASAPVELTSDGKVSKDAAKDAKASAKLAAKEAKESEKLAAAQDKAAKAAEKIDAKAAKAAEKIDAKEAKAAEKIDAAQEVFNDNEQTAVVENPFVISYDDDSRAILTPVVKAPANLDHESDSVTAEHVVSTHTETKPVTQAPELSDEVISELPVTARYAAIAAKRRERKLEAVREIHVQLAESSTENPSILKDQLKSLESDLELSWFARRAVKKESLKSKVVPADIDPAVLGQSKKDRAKAEKAFNQEQNRLAKEEASKAASLASAQKAAAKLAEKENKKAAKSGKNRKESALQVNQRNLEAAETLSNQAQDRLDEAIETHATSHEIDVARSVAETAHEELLVAKHAAEEATQKTNEVLKAQKSVKGRAPVQVPEVTPNPENTTPAVDLGQITEELPSVDTTTEPVQPEAKDSTVAKLENNTASDRARTANFNAKAVGQSARAEAEANILEQQQKLADLDAQGKAKKKESKGLFGLGRKKGSDAESSVPAILTTNLDLAQMQEDAERAAVESVSQKSRSGKHADIEYQLSLSEASAAAKATKATFLAAAMPQNEELEVIEEVAPPQEQEIAVASESENSTTSVPAQVVTDYSNKGLPEDLPQRFGA